MRYSITLPLAVYLPRVKVKDIRCPISVNWYRNAHHRDNNNAKILYGETIIDQFPKGELQHPLRTTFTFYAPDRRGYDLDNMTSVHKKFAHDVLVLNGNIENDTCEFIVNSETWYGGYDKNNGRVEMTIESFVPSM